MQITSEFVEGIWKGFHRGPWDYFNPIDLMVSASVFSSILGRIGPILFSVNSPYYIHGRNALNYENHSASWCRKLHKRKLLVLSCITDENCKNASKGVGNSKYKWFRISSNVSKEHQLAISRIPSKMPNRCKALMKQIICFSNENVSVPIMLASWVKSMKPQRADWLAVLKELDRLNHFLYVEVAEHALTEESFEANIRDYTKLIHHYAKKNMLHEAENVLTAMKHRGFLYDQVILTAIVHMYSKAGNLKLAEDSFEEMKSLGVPLDKRSYGSMIMAYIRAGMLSCAEDLLREMEAQEIYAGREVYKALLRAYSMLGDSQGAQRVFNSMQCAGIIPDAKVCGLLINAYVASGQSREARTAFENMRNAGLEPNDKCVALLLTVYEQENKLKEALGLLAQLERSEVALGSEASELLVKWFQKLGIADEMTSELTYSF